MLIVVIGWNDCIDDNLLLTVFWVDIVLAEWVSCFAIWGAVATTINGWKSTATWEWIDDDWVNNVTAVTSIIAACISTLATFVSAWVREGHRWTIGFSEKLNAVSVGPDKIVFCHTVRSKDTRVVTINVTSLCLFVKSVFSACVTLGRIGVSALELVGRVTVFNEVGAVVRNGQVDVDMVDERNWAVLRHVKSTSVVVCILEWGSTDNLELTWVFVHIDWRCQLCVNPRVELKVERHSADKFRRVYDI